MHIPRIFILQCVGAVGCAMQPAVWAQQPESPAACVEGAGPLALSYGDHTTGCDIGSPTDLDRFQFCGDTNDLVRLNVYSGGNFLDPVVEVRDPSFALVDTLTCTDSCSVSRDIELLQDGCYTLLVSDVSANDIGSYTLQVERLVPAPDGASLRYDMPAAEAIDPVTDTDFFSFEAAAGTELRLSVYAGGNFMDPTAEIRDPAGVLVVDGVADSATCTDSCSFSSDFSPATSGTYSLAISDRLINDFGTYSLSLQCLSGACPGLPDPVGPAISYHTVLANSISEVIDADTYTFNATPGSELRLNVYAGGNFMDPTVEIRASDGSLVVDGVADSATCTDSCSFSIGFSPALAGDYQLLIYDRATNDFGDYSFSLFCLTGACDSDADGLVDGDVRVSFDTSVVLAYGSPAMDRIWPVVDGDTYIFGGTAGDFVRATVSSTGNFMDPTIEVRDPTGTVILNGAADGATCTDSCSFSQDLVLDMTGTYELLIYDNATNDTGDYEIGLQCLVGACVDAVAACSDNCTDFANSASMPDAGGNVQLDTDGDGYGNACDPDYNNDGAINIADLGDMRAAFFGSDANIDLNGDGVVNLGDLSRMKKLFFGEPGPACID